jgi:DNA-directed RNA polymerase specialized sigma24 family protein
VEAWLVTIAHRRAIDVVRARSRRPVPTHVVAELVDPSTQTEIDPELLAALAALPDKQRWSVAYHYLAGLPYGEVAAIVGGTATAARRASADGIAALRRVIAGSSPDIHRGQPEAEHEHAARKRRNRDH